MKSTWFKTTFLLACLSLLAVGCGGGGGGGSSSNNYGNMSPITSGTNNANIDSQAVNLYNQLVTWRNNLQKYPQQERQLIGVRGYSKGIVENSSTSTPTIPAGCNEIKVFGYVVGYYCNQSGSAQPTQPAITPLQVLEKRCTREIYVSSAKPRVLKYASAKTLTSTSCEPNGNEAEYSIGSNTALNKLLNFELGKIYRILPTNVSGAFYVEVGPKGTFGNANKVYVIDTTMHSIYNPVVSQDFNDTSKLMRIYEAY